MSLSDITPTHDGKPKSLGSLAVLGGVLVVQLLVIALLYKHSFEFVCRDAAPAWLCAGLSGAIVRVIAMAGVAAVVLIARQEILVRFLGSIRPTLARPWLLLQFGGFIAVLLPWLFVSDESGGALVTFAMLLWIAGGITAGLGAALSIVPWRNWSEIIRDMGLAAAIALCVAALAPEIAGLFQNVWKYGPVTEFTFASVKGAIEGLGYGVIANPPIKELIVGEFGVLVGPQCSGVEGFLLITSFLGFYIWMFREQLRFPHALILLIIGVILSWCFNVLRIVALILIGHHWSPDLAINGFHSHAGWLMFTIIAIGLSLAAHAVPWFRKVDITSQQAAVPSSAGEPQVGFFEDPYTVQIFPFLVFMLSALLASTFFEVPAVAYPLRFVAMAAGLIIAVPFLRALEWRLDPLAIGAGALIGIGWIAVAPAPEPDSPLSQALAGMSVGILILWIVTRVLGTIVLVPAIEELVFRGYVLRRIDTGGFPKRVLAIAVSTALFAALHGRYIEAAVAGVVFALLMLRSGRLADAILCHMVANAVIALWAVARGDWAVI